MSQPDRQMSADNFKFVRSATAPLLGGTLLVGALLLLGGCVTTVGYESPYNEESSAGGIYQPPPPLPTYVQPPCPGDGYLWVPGYWAYSGGYYWVPGSWVLPPRVGLLWTPGYWGSAGGAYVWHAGYWGANVGFYGGVRYGFGYDGVGYRGGRWEGRHFVYNRYVTNVDEHVVHYTYDERMDRRGDGDRASYEGGRRGMVAYPARENPMYAHDAPMLSQRTHIEQVAGNPGGRPPVAATPRPGRLQWPGVERVRGAEGFGPQAGRSNGESRPSFPSLTNAPRRPDVPAHPNVQAGPRYQAPPAFHGQRPGAQQQPPRGVAARPEGAPRPQGRPVPERRDRSRHPEP